MQCDGEAAQRALAQTLGDKDPAVKEAAIEALAQSQEPQAMGLLRQAFRDSDSAVKMMVIENIGSTPDAVPLLLEASQDSEESVREERRSGWTFRGINRDLDHRFVALVQIFCNALSGQIWEESRGGENEKEKILT